MNSLFKIILFVLLFVSCGSSKKIKESHTSEKTSVKTEKIKKDSITDSKIVKIIKKDSIIDKKTTLPTENEIEFDLEDMVKNEGDFKSTVKSGEGNETTIEKKGSKIKITTKTAGSESIISATAKTETNEIEKNTKITEENNTTSVETEKTNDEKRIVIRKLPWWVWLIIPILIIGIIYFFRKKIVGVLVGWFPGLKAVKIFSKIIGLI